jgi:hypothetical protein
MSDTPIDGIPADLTRIVDISKVRGSQPGIIAKKIMPISDALREQGYKWFRVTAPADDEAHVYLEAWHEYPVVDGVLRQGVLDRSKAEVVTP